MFLITHLPEINDKRNLKELFKKLDINNDGRLS